MHIKRLRVTNFRGLETIDVSFDSLVSVVIGPNAIGKTTVLEAIRLAKAVLAPRTRSETTQVLNGLGATSPHMPQRMFPAAIARDVKRPLIIKCTYDLHDDDIKALTEALPQLATILAQQSVGLNFADAAQSSSFVSSPQGQQLIANAATALQAEHAKVSASRHIELNLIIDFSTGNMKGENQVHQLFFSALESHLPPMSSMFSYFPADRAMPIGEQAVQLGAADTNNQLESYNSQPQLKYTRLKHTIFNSIISSSTARDDLKADFETIFSQLLKGRALGEITVNSIGMLSIPIIDQDTQRQFEIDGLSSGEKGLILTFLLIARSVAKNGLILLDEPELHLNPSICREVLQFLVEKVAKPKNIQVIVCSHSAEILAGALERDDCSLFHLRGSKALSAVRWKDRGEIRDALQRLGSSESEALLYRGTLSVEGIHDVEILQTGFDDLFRRFRIRQRGGRTNIELDIKELQKAEQAGEEIGYHFFMFDRDRKPTALTDTPHVKLFQLTRHCLENYLLDVEIITDLTSESEFAEKRVATPTELRDTLKRLALEQTHEIAARDAFRKLGLEAVKFNMGVMRDGDASTVSTALNTQIEALKGILSAINSNSFEQLFGDAYKKSWEAMQLEWDERWRELCDGKRLFVDLRKAGVIRGDLLRLKKRIIAAMKNKPTETWTALESNLKSLVSPALTI